MDTRKGSAEGFADGFDDGRYDGFYDGWEQRPASLGYAAGVFQREAAESGEADTDGGLLDESELFDVFAQWVKATRGIDLWPHQEEAILTILSGDHTIVNTPTGSGKSLIALGMHFMALSRSQRSYYTAPLKALVSEKFFELVSVFGAANVGMITGDSQINPHALIICCTAEILANQALREGSRADVSAVAVDEFHFYADPHRGWAWQVPLITLPQTQFVLMSATLGDTDSIAESLEKTSGRQVSVVASAQRPVPLTYQYTLKDLHSVIHEQVSHGNAPIYVVHFAQEAAVETAQDLANLGVTTPEQRQAIKKALEGTRFTSYFGKTLKRLLLTGVGVHHAGMLPRYRRLVEHLAQEGLLPVICGTDTLGVGINVPIHTVVFTALTKYDGFKQRRLRAREFHQIAGRAGRSGFDSEGLVIALAPEHEIENAKALAKAGDDPKKLKKIKRKKAPEGFVNWSEDTLTKLINSAPETLTPHMQITHSMVLSEVSQGGDAWKRTRELIDASQVPAQQQEQLRERAAAIFQTLMDAHIVEKWELEDGTMDYTLTIDMPDDLALDQPLSPFLIAALELLDPESDSYALDVISAVEATLENPFAVLRAQQRRARDKARLDMKDDGMDYDERMDRLQYITYPKPLEDLLLPAFEQYSADVPWAADYELECKSVVRDMVQTASSFTQYVTSLGIARAEGTLLRYLSDAYRALSRTVPDAKKNEQLESIIDWLDVVVRTVDSSLVDEWEAAERGEIGQFSLDSQPAPPVIDEILAHKAGLTTLVRNALFKRVQLMDLDEPEELGRLDSAWGMPVHEWEDALDDFYEDHEGLLTNTEARSARYFRLDDSREKTHHRWHVRQILCDLEGDYDWAIDGVVDLDSTNEEGDVVFESYDVNVIEELPAWGEGVADGR
ncbi:DEAD/DEAH box helicase [Alloscardovia macacae]|uniref:DEAD/DEAH box helicase n=1 Tax=Alloscardovia macacae TaxID=1160091 RepID=A0A1Y2SYK2_9BIFI|nr:DEAD/DEAH box helicase [Alloscardovia macacae]OTA30300.1 DEAD/DEAH box helicase [Alloscardovia macacae]